MYYITVSNGLLDGTHKRRMGSAVWEFMWCLDKITKIDDDGDGWVLGGKPIQLKDIKGSSRDTISRNLNRLEKEGYLKLIHTMYGISIRVHKAKKRFNKNAEPKTERLDIIAEPNRLGKNAKPVRKNAKPNKIIQLDNTVDIVAEPNSAIGEVKPKWVLEDKLKEMEKIENSYLDIISTFIRKKNVRIDNSKQLSAVIERHCRPAKKLSGVYSNKQIFETIKEIEVDNAERKRKGQEQIDWVLETVYKHLTK